MPRKSDHFKYNVQPNPYGGVGVDAGVGTVTKLANAKNRLISAPIEKNAS